MLLTVQMGLSLTPVVVWEDEVPRLLAFLRELRGTATDERAEYIRRVEANWSTITGQRDTRLLPGQFHGSRT